MLTFGLGGEDATQSLYIGLGLGKQWYNIDKYAYDLQTDILIINRQHFEDYISGSTLLSKLESEFVFSWKLCYNFNLPPKFIVSLSLMEIYGLKYKKKYLPEGITWYYNDPHKLADMGSLKFMFSIGYKLL